MEKYSFTSSVVDLWNELADAIVLSTDVNAFKCNLDKLMRESRGHLQAVAWSLVLMITGGVFTQLTSGITNNHK